MGALPLVVILTITAPVNSPAQQIEVEPAVEWTALFDRTSGWTGADGIYSIPLSGREDPGGTCGERTLFVFSDTFVGEVDASGQRLAGSTLVNNSLAVIRGNVPDARQIEFFVRGDTSGPDPVFVPDTPSTQPGDWYWLSDGIAIEDEIHLFALRMMTGAGGVFNFAVAGVSRISIPIDSERPWADAVQEDAPLFLPSDATRGEIIFGGAIMPNTEQSAAPHPDGFIYVYGTQNDPFNKRLVAARVPSQEFRDFDRWRYRGSSGWSSSIADVIPLTGRISSEFSVTPLADGRYVLVFQLDTLGREVAIRVGEGPVGPWGPVRRIYTCPEPDFDEDVYTYNAKAHPHLSRPGELLISYNVNTFVFRDHFTYADIYRPRFIRVRLEP